MTTRPGAAAFADVAADGFGSAGIVAGLLFTCVETPFGAAGARFAVVVDGGLGDATAVFGGTVADGFGATGFGATDAGWPVAVAEGLGAAGAPIGAAGADGFCATGAGVVAVGADGFGAAGAGLVAAGTDGFEAEDDCPPNNGVAMTTITTAVANIFRLIAASTRESIWR